MLRQTQKLHLQSTPVEPSVDTSSRSSGAEVNLEAAASSELQPLVNANGTLAADKHDDPNLHGQEEPPRQIDSASHRSLTSQMNRDRHTSHSQQEEGRHGPGDTDRMERQP